MKSLSFDLTRSLPLSLSLSVSISLSLSLSVSISLSLSDFSGLRHFFRPINFHAFFKCECLYISERERERERGRERDKEREMRKKERNEKKRERKVREKNKRDHFNSLIRIKNVNVDMLKPILYSIHCRHWTVFPLFSYYIHCKNSFGINFELSVFKKKH